MRKQSAGNFLGQDFGNTRLSGESSLPGTKWLSRTALPKPPAPPVPPVTPQTQKPQTPQQAQQQRPPTNFFNNVMQNMPPGLNPKTPAGFGAWAQMFRPVTENVMRVGGLPALMSIYGQVSGDPDVKLMTTKQSSKNEKQASLTKRSADPVLPQSLYSRNTSGGAPPTSMFQRNNAQLPAIQFRQLEKPNIPTAKQQFERPEIDAGAAGRQLATDLGVWGGTRIALGQAAKRLTGSGLAQHTNAARMGHKLAPTRAWAPGAGVLPGIGVWSLTNAGTDVLDLAGLYDKAGTKGGLGRPGWDFKELNVDTTPTDITSPLSYAGSGLNAFNRPLPSATSLASFAGPELTQPDAHLKHYLYDQPWKPGHKDYAPGGKAFSRLANQYKTRNQYHPRYNREGPGRGDVGKWWDWLWN